MRDKEENGVMPSAPGPEILKIEVHLGGHVYREDLSHQAAIEANLPGVNQGLAENPSRVAWWATLAALAGKEEDEARDALDILDSELAVRYQTDPAISVTLLKAKIRTNADRRRLATAYREAQYKHQLIRAALKSLEDRKASLRELSANLREEMTRGLGVPSVVEQARASHRALQDRVRQGEFRESGHPL